ncbi:MAG TPA: YceI family protein [Phenylobacterium sp.]|uniref:YceI family protein n=1 Tax=Phenylobacterium sp. TaxID=1871053 RepID=UPI002B485A69|nr:YceI family protein [Phenylobacterium sp.]HKR88795.1 YceI family protein [Phenylobacterium sp.]
MRPFAIAIAAAAVVASAGQASAAAPAWRADMAASRLGFTGAMNGQAFKGAFGRWDAQIAFDPKDLAGSHVTATIDMASARTGDRTRDEALPTADWFSAKAYPKASFVSRKITAAGPGRYVAQGDLTVRGVTRPVSLPFTLTITGDAAKMTGSVVLDRSAFGVGQGQWKGGEPVSLKVQVDVAITARRSP